MNKFAILFSLLLLLGQTAAWAAPGEAVRVRMPEKMAIELGSDPAFRRFFRANYLTEGGRQEELKRRLGERKFQDLARAFEGDAVRGAQARYLGVLSDLVGSGKLKLFEVDSSGQAKLSSELAGTELGRALQSNSSQDYLKSPGAKVVKLLMDNQEVLAEAHRIGGRRAAAILADAVNIPVAFFSDRGGDGVAEANRGNRVGSNRRRFPTIS